MRARTTWSVFLLGSLMGAAVAGADYNAGVAAFHQKDYAAAEAHFGEAVSRNDKHAGSYYMLGRCQSHLGKTADAVANLSEAVNLTPENAEYAIALASAFNSDRQPQEAFDLMWDMDADSIDPGLRNSHALVLAGAAIRLGREEDAAAVLEKRLSEDPSDPSLHRAAGVVFDRLGRVTEAFDAYAHACALSADDAALCRAAVTFALASNDTDLPETERQEMLDKAADIASGLAEATTTSDDRVLAGEASMYARRFEAATGWFEKAGESASKDPLTMYYWGRSLASAGAHDRASSKLEEALRLKPEKSLASRMHTLLARLAECRLDLATAGRHHRLAGNERRADELSTVAAAYGKAFAQRADLVETIAGLRRTLPQLENLGDEAGVKAITTKISGLEHELETIDLELGAVRSALEQSCP